MADHDLRDPACLPEVESLVKSGSYREALARLEELRGSNAASYGPLEKAKTLELESQCYYGLGSYRKALIKAKAGLFIARRLNDHSLYAGMKFVLGWLLEKAGRTADAAEAFNESYVFYKRSRSYASVPASLNALAHVQSVAGHLERSCENFELAIEYATKYRSRETADTIRRNLARALVLRGHIARALAVIQSTDASSSDRWGGADGDRVIGYTHLLRLDIEQAEKYLKRSMEVFTELGTARDIAVSAEYLGLLEHYRGNYCKAGEYFRQVLEMPEPTASAVAQTLRMLTDVHIAEGKFNSAMITARKAEDAIGVVGERIEMGALYRAYGQIHSSRGEAEVSRGFFKRSIDVLGETGARYELALSHFAAGMSEMYRHAERMYHLETARMLFVDMDVPRRVEQVDEALTGLRPVQVPGIVVCKPQDSRKPTIVAVNPSMKKLLTYAEEIAKSDINVLLTGETGTGKDLLANYIHCVSGRTGGFVTVNAAAIPNEMIEAELFGYAEGAFTGAKKSKQGLLETAENGTICLNEIADATPELQVKLLEVLETRRIRRLGETSARPVNFRLIAACNRDLGKLIAENRFRRDLFHRLDDLSIELPSLRDRIDDIPALVKYFLSESLGNTCTDNGNAEALERLGAIMSARDYPGNVRELRARVNELALASRGDLSQMLVLALNGGSPGECEVLRRLLESTGWNRSHTAWIMGVSEGTIRNRIKKYNITRS